VPAEFTAVAAETRRTFTVADERGSVALFNEPGPEISADEFAWFLAGYAAALPGAAVVVVSLGPAGLLAVTEEGCWRSQPAAAAAGNATGAGDAVTAALAHGLATGSPWDERLRHAAALGAATVAAPVAGEFSGDAYAAGLNTVTVNQEDVSACS
jgi:fructose-1-phosphate kinase PfkB-like protein